MTDLVGRGGISAIGRQGKRESGDQRAAIVRRRRRVRIMQRRPEQVGVNAERRDSQKKEGLKT
jgi:hypothetical protein